MKRTAIIISAVLVTLSGGKAIAQKDATEKSARKEAKKLDKEGWQTLPGAIPLETQVVRSWQKAAQVDERDNPVYLHADGMATATIKSVAEAQAMEFARLTIAGLIETKILSVIEANLSNVKVEGDGISSLTQVVRNSKNTITTKLGFVDPVLKIYRILPNGDCEMHITVFYNVKQTLEYARSVIGTQVSDKLSGEQLDKLLTLN